MSELLQDCTDEGLVEVRNARTGLRQSYTPLTPRKAVICAYAQERGDWNTWNYEYRYAHVVEIVDIGGGGSVMRCGDWEADNHIIKPVEPMRMVPVHRP